MQPLDLLVADASNLLIPPLNIVTKAIFGNVSLTIPTSCYLQNAMSFIGYQLRPTQTLPQEADDFPRSDKYFKLVPLLTSLIYFSPKYITQ